MTQIYINVSGRKEQPLLSNADDKQRKMMTETRPLSLATWKENFLTQKDYLLTSQLDSYLQWVLSPHTCLTHLGTGLLSLLSPPSRALCLVPGRRSHQVWKWQNLDVRRKHAIQLRCGPPEFRPRAWLSSRRGSCRTGQGNM